MKKHGHGKGPGVCGGDHDSLFAARFAVNSSPAKKMRPVLISTLRRLIHRPPVAELPLTVLSSP